MQPVRMAWNQQKRRSLQLVSAITNVIAPYLDLLMNPLRMKRISMKVLQSVKWYVQRGFLAKKNKQTKNKRLFKAYDLASSYCLLSPSVKSLTEREGEFTFFLNHQQCFYLLMVA